MDDILRIRFVTVRILYIKCSISNFFLYLYITNYKTKTRKYQ